MHQLHHIEMVPVAEVLDPAERLARLGLDLEIISDGPAVPGDRHPELAGEVAPVGAIHANCLFFLGFHLIKALLWPVSSSDTGRFAFISSVYIRLSGRPGAGIMFVEELEQFPLREAKGLRQFALGLHVHGIEPALFPGLHRGRGDPNEPGELVLVQGRPVTETEHDHGEHGANVLSDGDTIRTFYVYRNQYNCDPR